MISQVNGVWHGDIHYIVLNNGDIHYLFALIDDRSRYIIHWGLFEHKIAENVRNVFEEAIIKNNTTQLAFWNDNGLENCGRIMEQFLQQNEIFHIKTLPGNPQSNRKIEKWWNPLQKRINEISPTNWEEVISIINSYVINYNEHIPHMGLEKIGLYHAYPIEVYTNPTLQKTTIDECTLQIDQHNTITLRNFLHIDAKK